MYGLHNDGYGHAKSQQTSPFTEYETFRGIELRRANELLEDDKISLTTYKTYYDVVMLLQELMVDILEIERHLYFNYIHLIKRTVKPDITSRPEEDLSHPIHGDNCIFDPEVGECAKEEPAFTFRDWTATLYLNKPEKGGSFIFVNEKKEIQREVEVEPGRLLGFHAALLHGVKPLLGGSRYAIGVWFTHDIDKAIDMATLSPKRYNKKEKAQTKVKEEL